MYIPENIIKKRKILFLASLFLAFYLPAQELRVYQTSTIPVKDREKALKGDASLSGIQVTVFGQFREFESANKTAAKYVIMPSSWIKYNSEYKPVYQFSKDGQTNTKLMILTTKPEWTMENIGKGKAGIVDELGRKNTKKYVQDIAGKFKLIKRVTKPEDLMPLLVLENADYIIIRSDNYEVLKKKFTAKTIKVGETKTVDHAVLCVLKDTPDSEIEKLGKLSPETIKALGYSELKKL
ncbi:MAG: hypothetical protein NE327_08975 [Lentisphaeraceae bacterium]|nr:hypothetical protein [Lentisphaeraceae bacterium]